ncbi:MAG: flagella basal body P-ring formation protein FlgA, partial [Acidimicrobiia bacterium]|nr:flagella basal body P-ring formation protein FlgA [Acidimicrobiia bacterium]
MAPLTSLREAGTSPAARRRAIRRPAFSHVLIALAVILAFVFNLLALQDRSDTQLVAVVEEPLVAGSVISPRDIRFVPVGSDFEGLAGLITEDAWPGLEGWVVNRSIASGVPLDLGSLSEPIAGG